MTTIHVEPRDTIQALKRAVRSSRDDAQKTRVRAIIKLKEGLSKTAVATELTLSRTALIEWIKRYNDGGTKALIFDKGGRSEGNPVWDTNIFTQLAKEIDKGGYWSIPRMQQWIKDNHQEEIPEQTVWYRMNRQGYSYKSARPHPVKGNEAKQTEFKKGVSPRSWSR